MIEWHYKGLGRIYVSKEGDIKRVEKILKELDPAEWEMYAPEEIIAVWTGKHDLIYVHKFEPNLEALAMRCLEEGIPVWWSSGYMRAD
jgi:hypothetical protein